MSDPIISEIPITVFGNIETYSPVISKSRCRMFYKGLNRNQTFISDEFAEKLIATVPYAPVKGIYDNEERDYTDHGKRRDLGRIYGVVPAEPNFAWEKHLDEDGVEREYACVDVLLYTALYKEAGEITGKAQSMELYADSIKGDWKVMYGRKCYVYEDACFLGLQALGNNVEPCFEGAAFYNLDDSKEFLNEVNNYNKQFQNNGQGGQTMPNDLFKLSDDAKAYALMDLLNSAVDSDGYRIFDTVLCDVYDDYAVAYTFSNHQHERIYYKKEDATDSVEITGREPCWIIDVNEFEKTILNNVRANHNGTFEKVDEELASIEGLHTRIAELESVQGQLNDQIVVMTTDKEKMLADLTQATENYTTLQAEKDALAQERDNLVAYKKNIEDNAKLAVIDTYADTLSEDILNEYRANLDKYTCEELDMRLTYVQKKSNPAMFQKQATPAYIPKDEGMNSGINSILDKYEKK